VSRRVELREGTDRYVLLLEGATAVYRDRLEGSIRSRFNNQINGFLFEDTPESALEDEDKFPTPLRQLKDRGGKVRGLGVWCQGSGYDVFVVQVIYNKEKDEDKILAKAGKFQGRAQKWDDEISNKDNELIEAKIDDWERNPDIEVFKNPE